MLIFTHREIKDGQYNESRQIWYFDNLFTYNTIDSPPIAVLRSNYFFSLKPETRRSQAEWLHQIFAVLPITIDLLPKRVVKVALPITSFRLWIKSQIISKTFKFILTFKTFKKIKGRRPKVTLFDLIKITSKYLLT